MTDLEMTKLCAEAMGIEQPMYAEPQPFNPLDDDAQAMALVKKLRLNIFPPLNNPNWQVWLDHRSATANPDLNRAIVECTAKISSSSQSANRGKANS